MNIKVVNEEKWRCTYCGEWGEAYETEVWKVDPDYQTSGPSDVDNYWYFSEEPEAIAYYRSECCGEEADDEEGKFYVCGECNQLYPAYDRTEAVQCCR